MTSLSPEAIAIIGGYHADPFRYLGRHDEGTPSRSRIPARRRGGLTDRTSAIHCPLPVRHVRAISKAAA